MASWRRQVLGAFALLEDARQVGGVARPVVGVLLQQVEQHLLEERRHARAVVRWPRHGAVQVRVEHLVRRRRLGERVLAGRDLVQHDAERVEVALRARRLAAQRLRRGVGEAAGEAEARRAPRRGAAAAAAGAVAAAAGAERPRQPEVDDLELAVGREDQVLRLDVAVGEAALVQRRQPLGGVGTDAPRQVLDRRARAGDELAQRRAAHVLHHQVGRGDAELVVGLDAVDRRDVGVPQLLADLALGEQAGVRALVVGELGAQELDRDLAAGRQLAVRLQQPGAVDRARRPAAELLQQLETAGDTRVAEWGCRGGTRVVVLGLLHRCVVAVRPRVRDRGDGRRGALPAAGAAPRLWLRACRRSATLGTGRCGRLRMAIRLYNSLTRSLTELQPRTPGRVTMYHCGPTVYSSPHIGNFRSFLFADVLRRFVEDQGLQVTQVMNITDVGHLTLDDVEGGEDKMEAASRKTGLTAWDIAKKYEAEFHDCQRQLHVRLPHQMPRATAFIDQMGAIIDDLLAKGVAYQRNGNVYFEVAKFPAYGKLSGKVLDELEAGARVAVNDEKKDPRDFALWKVDSKHQMQWDAPFRGGARGFPGWHIECSAMSMHYLGAELDVHTGGEDNMFPHHECEIAQTEAHTGKPFVAIWMHARHLLVDGTKMSKSLGNFFTVADILAKGYSGLELRYALVCVQYRQALNFTMKGLDAARASIARVQQARGRLGRVRDGRERAGGDDLAPAVAAAHAGFTAAMSDDLNVSEALAAVFEFVGAVNKAQPSAAGAREALAAFARFEDVLGCFGAEPKTDAGSEAPPELLALLAQRKAAKQARDWATADRIRDQVAAAGWKIVDAPSGARLEKA
ncbi:MAG: cysteine--tRNA ligase [Pirellulales bacterium]